MGLTSAVTIFTDVLKPVKSYLRGLGWRGLLYIDDVISGAKGHNEASYWKCFVTDVLGRAGWCICNNVTKRLLLPVKKLECILDGCKLLLKKKNVHVKQLASVVGTITSCISALGLNFTNFFIHSLYRDLCSKVD